MKKVAIVGYTPTKNLAPYNNPEFEIWGMNDLYRFIPKYDRWFEFHGKDRPEYNKPPTPGRTPWPEVKKVFAQMPCPVYLQEQSPEIPTSVKFPLAEIQEAFAPYFINPNHKRYFTNSVAYMLALAIYEGFEEIHIYGVDMATASEYGVQRPSCEFWLGVAIGKGIKIHIPDEADLLQTRFMYGYEDNKKDAYVKKVEHTISNLEQQKANTVQQKKQLEMSEWQYVGAITALKEMTQTWA